MSASASNLVEWNILSFGKELNHYHTMPHFHAPKMYNCGKHCEKRRNCLKQAISSFLTMFSTLYGTYFSFKCTLKCRLQFVSIWTSRIFLSFGKELTFE